MNFREPLDELAHYVGQLAIDVRLGVDRRHLLSTSRLCFLLIERIEKLEQPVPVEAFKRLEIELLDLQRAIGGTRPAQPQPRVHVKGSMRVIDGGRA